MYKYFKKLICSKREKLSNYKNKKRFKLEDHQIYELVVITNKNKYLLIIQTKKKYKEIWISNLDKSYLEIYSAYESLKDLEEYVLNKFQENKEVVKYTKKKRI